MAVTREFTFPSSAAGQTVYATEWIPEGRQVRAVVQVSHGVSDHIGRYAPLGEFLAGHGIVMVGNDHIGHGRSAGGHPDHFADTDGWGHAVRDLHTLRELTGRRYSGVPYILLGHSMGSFLARTYLLDYPDDGLAAAVLSGTGQDSPFRIWLGRCISGALLRLRGGTKKSKILFALTFQAYNRHFRPNRTACDWISGDDAVVDAYIADPYCRYDATVGLFRDMLGGLRRLASPEALGRMNPDLPLYLFAGTSDPVGEKGKGVVRVADALRAAGCRDVTVKLYPGGRHEMLNERNRGEVFADLLAWLEGHL